MKIPGSGFSVYATELLANALSGLVVHQSPVLAVRIRWSDRLDKDIRADLRTPPTTTTSPVLQTISWHSIEESFLPLAPLNLRIVKSNKSTRGWGPLALPPNVLSLVPTGLTFDMLILGTLPVYK